MNRNQGIFYLALTVIAGTGIVSSVEGPEQEVAQVIESKKVMELDNISVGEVETQATKEKMISVVETLEEVYVPVIKEEPVYVAPKPKPAQTTTRKCHANYTGCVPIASDVDCAGGSGNGPAYVRGPVRVIGPDVYRLDRDKDGIACE